MHHADVAVGGIENIGAAGLGGNAGFAPIHFNLLAGVGADAWDLDPDGGSASDGVPLLDLIGKRGATQGGETNVATIALRLSEIEVAAVQTQQHGEVSFRSTRGDVCTVWSRENEERCGIRPCGIGLDGHGVNLSGAVLGGDCVGLRRGEIPRGARDGTDARKGGNREGRREVSDRLIR